MSNSFLKAFGYDTEEENLSPILLNSAVVESKAFRAPASEQTEVPPAINEKTPSELFGQLAVSRNANYQAPQIAIPEEDPASQEAQKNILSKLSDLDTSYKQNLQDAEDRRFKSEIFAALGNYLPGVVAGATAMKTKASVKPSDMPKISARDVVGEENQKFKNDYDRLLGQYKTLKDGSGLSAKDRLYANMAQAQLDHGAARLNNNIETTDRNLIKRVGDSELAHQSKNELSDKQIESLAGYDDTLTSLKRIEEQKKKVSTGPLADKKNRIASTLGIDDPEVTSLRSEVIDTLAAKIKALSGTAANESEVKRLEVTLPSIADSDTIFNRKLKDAEVRIREARKIRQDHFKSKQGKNVQGYENKQNLAPKDQQALDWAKKNSADPRAAAIIKKLGQ